MIPLKNEKSYPFQSFQGREPTPEELRQEMEDMYIFIIDQISKKLEEVRKKIPGES